jgi:c-di-GMP-binding flagellar brake protein YcgR
MSNYVYDRRRFNRTDSIACKVKAGNNLDNLYSVKMLNISAGGISFSTDKNLKLGVNSKIFLEIFVHYDLSEVSFIVDGQIIRHDNDIYAIKFIDIEPHVQDELNKVINLSIERGIKEMVLFDPSKTFFRDEV